MKALLNGSKSFRVCLILLLYHTFSTLSWRKCSKQPRVFSRSSKLIALPHWSRRSGFWLEPIVNSAKYTQARTVFEKLSKCTEKRSFCNGRWHVKIISPILSTKSVPRLVNGRVVSGCARESWLTSRCCWPIQILPGWFTFRNVATRRADLDKLLQNYNLETREKIRKVAGHLPGLPVSANLSKIWSATYPSTLHDK